MNKETTTIERNTEIAEYMGYEFKINTFHGDTFQKEINEFRIESIPVIEYNPHDNWSILMPIWQKMWGELNPIRYKSDGHFRTNRKPVIMKGDIESAILSCDITTAHRLIYEAIVYLKNVKK